MLSSSSMHPSSGERDRDFTTQMLPSSSMHPSSSSAEETDLMASSEETSLNIPHLHESEIKEEEKEEKEEEEEQQEEEPEAGAGAGAGLIVEPDMKVNNGMIEIFLLSSTVIAGCCYAAMLTLTDNFGRLGDRTTFAYIVFVYCNLLAVFFAILTVVSIVWLHSLERRRSVRRAFDTSAVFLAFAMMCMIVAVTSGAVVVTKKSEAIQTGVLMLGICCILFVYRFTIPLVMNSRQRLMMGGRAH